MNKSKPKIYDSAVVLNCNFDLNGNQIIGENSFVKDCTLGQSVRINRRNFIQGCSIGDFSYTGHNTTLKYVTIGKFCSISWNVSAGGANHDYQFLSTHPFSILSNFGFTNNDEGYNSYYEPCIIGNDVWIGSGAEILRGVKIGDGAIIGAGSVITKDVPPYSIFVGNPGKLMKYRFSDDIITRLMNLNWWDIEPDLLKNILPMFRKQVTHQLIDELYDMIHSL